MSNKKLFIIFLLFIAVFIAVLKLMPKNKKNDMIPVYVSTADCAIQEKKCQISLGEINFNILMDENIYYLKKFNVDVFVESKFKNNIKSIKVSFKMKNMNMGVNAFTLNKVLADKQNETWKANAILPICVSGRADWVSELEVIIKNNKYILVFPVQVKK